MAPYQRGEDRLAGMRIKICLRNLNGNELVYRKNIERVLEKYGNGFRIISKKGEIEVVSRKSPTVYFSFLECIKRDFGRFIDVDNPLVFSVKIEQR